MIHVVVPAYNCRAFIGRCLDSLHAQDVPFHALVIDDASTDGTDTMIAAACETFGWDFTLNRKNLRAGYNLFHGVRSLDAAPDDPVFLLDGDDSLPHAGVLRRVLEVYEDPDVWFAYGNYAPWPRNTGQVQSRPYPPELLRDAPTGVLRRAEQYANHPITARAFLFAELTAAEMCDRQGKWLRGGYDRVMFTPMIEMASRGHVHFIDEILYRYTAVNPLSDTYANLPDVQHAHAAVIRRPARKPLYEPLPHRIGEPDGVTV